MIQINYMPKMMLKEEDKIKILMMKNTTTTAEIARQLGRNRSTIHCFIDKVKKTGKITNIKPQGRPKLFNRRLIRKIVTYTKRNKNTTINDIRQKLNLHCCRETISKVLHQNKFKYLTRRLKPKISTRNIIKRKEFAQQIVNMSERKLRTFVFSDECSVELSKYYKKKGWRLKGTTFNQENIIHGNQIYIKKYIKFWAFLCINGQSNVIFINDYGKWNRATYLKLLKANFINELTNLGLNANQIYHYEDKDTVHNGESIKNWKSTVRIKSIDGPPQSADINPIENAFGILKKAMFKTKYHYKEDEIKDIIRRFWANLDINIVKKLVLSFRKRNEEILKNNGFITKY